MRRILLLLSGLFCLLSVRSQVFNIRDYGALPDAKTLNTLAIQQTIDKCAEAGGGTVYVPAGTFITGTIHLRSNINLFLERGAILKGSSTPKDYESFHRPGFGATCYGILFSLKAENVSISGYGTIDGSEEAFFNWQKAKKIEWGGVEFTRQKENYRKVESGIGDGPVDPDPARPHQMIIFSQCKNVLVENVKISRSPFWTLHFADCDGVIVKGVKIWNSMETPNSDGMDITSCNNVDVSDCDIRAGDDAIAITGFAYHYELPGYYNLRHASGNININNCNLQSRSSGIRIGYEDQNSVKNINISNINITNSNRGIGIFVRDSGSIENIHISNIFIQTRLHTGDWWGNGEPVHISATRGKKEGKLGQIKNVTLRDITCVSENGILLYGTAESVLDQVTLENVKLTIVDSKLNDVEGGNIDLRGCLDPKEALFEHDNPGLYAQFVKDLSIQHFTLVWKQVLYPWFTHGIEVDHFTYFNLGNYKGSGAPGNDKAYPVMLRNGVLFKTDLEDWQVKKEGVK